MTPPGRLRELFQEALDLPPAKRAEHLDEACGGDLALRREVEALVEISESQVAFLDGVRVGPTSIVEPQLTNGDTIDQFRIVRRLGRGGMGTVYLAEDEVHLRPVALKVLHRSSSRLSTLERHALARLSHPGIASLYDSGRTPQGLPYFAMELVHGQPIDEYCAANDLSIRKRLRLFQKVCEAVAYAHRRQVVHRDLKPSNVLVTEAGEPKLVDFGIAKILPEEFEKLAGDLTATSERPLSLAYASPEQLAGEWTGTASDVYSLGVLLSVLLTGELPYRTESPHDLSWAIRNTDPQPPSSRLASRAGTAADQLAAAWNGLDRQSRLDLDAIVLRALRKEPEQRYVDVPAMVADVAALLEHRPVAARRGSWTYRSARFLRRNRITVALSGVVAVLLIVGVGALAQAALQARRASREARVADRTLSLLEDVIGQADPSASGARNVTLREALDSATESLRKQIGEEPEVAVRVLGTLGRTYTQLGAYGAARPLLEQARSTALGRESVAEARAIFDLAVLDQRDGRLAAAINGYRRALTMQGRRLGEEHIDYQTTLTRLGRCLLEFGREPEAEALLAEAVRVLESRGGSRELLSDALHGLALVREALGIRSTSEADYRRALEIRREVLRPGHPKIAETITGLAVHLNAAGRNLEAEALLEEAFRGYEDTFGQSHPSVATALHNLAAVRGAQGETDDALTLFHDAIDLRRRLLGAQHPDLAKTLNALGALQVRLGNLSAAEPLFRESADIRQASLPADHPATAESLNNLGVLLQRQSRYEEASVMQERALRIYRTHFGDTHTKVATVLRNLAFLDREEGNLDAAERRYREALDIDRQLDSSRGHPLMVALNNLAALLRDRGRFEESLALYDEALAEGVREAPGHWLNWRIELGKAELLAEARPDEALALARGAEEGLRETFGEDHPHTAIARGVLGGLLMDSGREEEGRALVESSIETIREAFGESSTSYTKALARLNGEPAEAPAPARD